MVRVIKCRLPGGETETVITGLPDRKYGARKFKGLYFWKRPIEGKYDEVKKKPEAENDVMLPGYPAALRRFILLPRSSGSMRLQARHDRLVMSCLRGS
jgi:hypothetical protein